MPVKVPVVQTGLEASIRSAMTKAGKSLKIDMGPGSKSIEGLSQPLGRLTGKADDFTKSMTAANARVLAFGASVAVIGAVTKGFKELVSTTIQVEKSLANINSILKQNTTQLESLKGTLFDIAKNTEQSFDSVADAALELSRQGLKAEEVTSRLNDALILSRLSGLSAADAVSGLTAAVNSFSKSGITTSEVLNKISAAAASAAVSDRDLIEGLKRSGSVAVSTGVEFDELIGIISALQQKTARGGAVIGNSLKTIFTRIQDIDKLETLMDLGVQVTDVEGKVLSANKVIENLAPIFAKLDQTSKVNLADNLVGKFQIAPFLSLLEQYNEEVVISNRVAATSLNATNEAYQRNEVLSKTLSTSINSTKLSFQELADELGRIGVTDNLQGIVDFFGGIAEKISGVLKGDSVGSKFAKGIVAGIGNVLAGPGMVLVLAVIAKLAVDFAKFGVNSLKTFFGLNRAAKEQAMLQGQIASALLNDSNIRKSILDIENSSLTVEQKRKMQADALTTAYNAQLNVMKQMQTIAASIAPSVMRGTLPVRTGRASGRRAADGFLPVGAERSDIARGVGGAPSSAKPVVIPNFAYGGNKTGPMVANSSEYIVPNYANGGDAIFNQNMVSSMGLPAGARKINAAGGYIPNFVKRFVTPKKFENKYRLTNDPNKPIANKTYSSFYDKNGNLIGGERGDLHNYIKNNPNTNLSKAIVRMKTQGKRTYYANKKPRSIMLVPRPMGFDPDGVDHKFLGAGYKSKRNGLVNFFEGGISGVDRKIRNEKGASGEKLDGLLDIEENIKEHLAKGVNNVFTTIDKGLFEVTPKEITKGNIQSIMEKGGSGALGAIEGAVFEAIFQAITGSLAQDDGDLDIQFSKANKEKRGLINTVFGLGRTNFDFGDYKSSAGQKDKYVRQVLNNVPSATKFHRKPKLRPEKGSIPPNGVGTAASGYIPNFAGGLEDAIDREKAAGLPVSQIRINQSGKLRNAQNPMGLAVTNTRDEPTGAVPNYAAKNTNKGGEKEGESGMAMFGGKLMMASVAIGLLQGVVSQTADSQEKANKSLFTFSNGLQLVMTAMTTHMMMSMIPTQGLASGLASRGSKIELAGFGTTEKGMKKGGKLGALMKGAGKLTRVFGGLVQGVSRFLPVIGPVIVGITAIGFIMKKLGVDLKGVGKIFVNALKKGANMFMSIVSGIFKTVTFASRAIFKVISKIPGMGKYGEMGVDAIDSAQGKLDSMRFQTDTFGESLSKAKKGTSERKGEESPKEITKEQELTKEIAKQIQSIKLSTAKAEISHNIKMAQLGSKRLSDSKILLDSVKESKTLSEKELRRLEDTVQLEEEQKETNNQLLSVFEQQLGKIEGITVKTEHLAQANKNISSALGDGKLTQEEILNITNKVIDSVDQNKTLNKAIKGDLVAQVRQLLAQRNLSQEIVVQDRERTRAVQDRLRAQKEFNLELAREEKVRQSNRKLADTRAINEIDLEIAEIQRNKSGSNADARGREKKIAELNKQKSTIIATSAVIAAEKALENATKALEVFKEERNRSLNEKKQLITDPIRKEETAAKEEQAKLTKEEAGITEQIEALKKQIESLGGEVKEGAKEGIKEGINFARPTTPDKNVFRPVQGSNSGPNLGGDPETPIVDRIKKGIVTDLAVDRENALKQLSDLKIQLKDNQEKLQSVEKKKNKAQQELQEIETERNIKPQNQKDNEAELKVLENAVAESASNLEKVKKGITDVTRKFETAADKFKNAFESFVIQQNIEQFKFDEINAPTQAARTEAAFKRKASEEALRIPDEEGRAKFLRDAPLKRTYEQRRKLLQLSDLEIDSRFKDEVISTSEKFRENIISAFAEGITSAKSLKELLLNTAQQFISEMSKSYIKKFMDGSKNESSGGGSSLSDIFGAGKNIIGSFFGIGTKKQGGGSITGGSGTKDDVPAVLMGGEFVMNKKAVKKYGMGFMSSLNNGAVQGFARGGIALPGFQGAGAITGVNDLMSFATQSNDPGMGNMTMFGRRNSRIQKRYQDAKGQAFDLGVSEVRAREEAEKQKKSLGKMILAEVTSAVVSHGIAKMGGGTDAAKLLGSSLGNIAGASLNSGYGASSGAIGAASTGDDFLKELSEFVKPVTSLFTDNKKATGGAISSRAGVDTVPAMLSGGEFIMNSAATERIGADNLSAANAGGSGVGGDSTKLVAKIEELINVTQESGKAGDISITINGSDGKETQQESGETNKNQRELSEKIKTVVKQVISDEQRLGGQLRK